MQPYSHLPTAPDIGTPGGADDQISAVTLPTPADQMPGATFCYPKIDGGLSGEQKRQFHRELRDMTLMGAKPSKVQRVRWLVEKADDPGYDAPDGLESGECGDKHSKQWKRDYTQNKRQTRAMVGAIVTTIAILAFIGLLVPLITAWSDIHSLWRTTDHLQHELDKHDTRAEVDRIQDYLVLQMYQPCSTRECNEQRLKDMFGGTLPKRYYESVLNIAGYSINNDSGPKEPAMAPVA